MFWLNEQYSGYYCDSKSNRTSWKSIWILQWLCWMRLCSRFLVKTEKLLIKAQQTHITQYRLRFHSCKQAHYTNPLVQLPSCLLTCLLTYLHANLQYYRIILAFKPNCLNANLCICIRSYPHTRLLTYLHTSLQWCLKVCESLLNYLYVLYIRAMIHFYKWVLGLDFERWMLL